jgi:hypothetical protein
MKVTGTISKAALTLIFALAAPGFEREEQQRESGQDDRSKDLSRIEDGTEGTSK